MGQVQLPSLAHFYAKLTLCQPQMYELQYTQQGASLCVSSVCVESSFLQTKRIIKCRMRPTLHINTANIND